VRNRPYTKTEKALVEYFKKTLEARGISKFPRDWYLKQLSCARTMLDGSDAPTIEQWQGCIDWAQEHPFWGDKIDHLARVSWLWMQYCLQKQGEKCGTGKIIDKSKELKKKRIKDLYMS